MKAEYLIEDSPEKPPLLSVVIIGINEGSRIVKCIQSVKNAIASIPDSEIVYIDSGSDDDTVELAYSQGVRIYELGCTQSHSPAAGRYVGTRVTHGQFILFVDGDSRIANGWIPPALQLMQSNSDIVMFAGQLVTDPERGEVSPLPEVRGIGEIQPAFSIGGGRAPIIERKSLEIAGNWNPFVRSREEEDLAIRMRTRVPGAKIVQSSHVTAWSPVYSLTGKEVVRRWRRGFLMGPGQIFKNAIIDGYWTKCAHVMRSAILSLAFILALSASLVFHCVWQFLLIFGVGVVMRAVLTRKLIRIYTIFYSLLSGFYSIWEFIIVPVRTGSDYVCDYKERA